MNRLLRFAVLLVCWVGVALPAQASVTITFWSHELGNSFPHAFFTLRGVPDAGGAPVDVNYGFTARTVSPALLFGTVPGRLDISKPGYVDGSDAQFSVVLTDAQYNAELALIAAWDEMTGDSHYKLNERNCVHFVKEAAARAGLTGLDQPGLMKKPRSYLQAVAAANEGHVVKVDMHGKQYLASLTPLDAAPVAAAPAMPAPMPGAPVPYPTAPASTAPDAMAAGGAPAPATPRSSAPPVGVLPPAAPVPAPTY